MIRHTFIFLEVFTREGGIQSYVQDILLAYACLAERSQNYQADVFLLRDAPPSQPIIDSPYIKFHYCRTPWHNLSRLRMSAALSMHLAKRKPNHIFCGHIKLAKLVQWLAVDIPYTVMTYGKEVWFSLSLVDRTALAKARWVWTISRFSRDRLCTFNQFPPEQVRILPCIVDGDRFKMGQKPQYLLDRYKIDNHRVLMTVTRLWSKDPYKGVDVTIQALPIIAQVVPNIRYLVIGRGDDQPRLTKLAKDCGVGDRVIFAGFVPGVALPDHYRLADVYVMPSQEGFGIVYLEAMATGVPVIAGQQDGSAEPLMDGRLGWHVPHRDPQAIAQACLEALQGQDQRCDRLWLREQALTNFGQERLIAALEKLFDEQNSANPPAASLLEKIPD
jgi:glycosyltransferase involved in cell wall biosynthesis